MADIDALQRRDIEIRHAEMRAVHALAAHLRDAVAELPSESRLALTFVQQANKLDGVARERTPVLGAKFHLEQTEREIRDLPGRRGRRLMPADDRGNRLATIATELEGMSAEDRAEILERLGRGVPLEDVEAFIADRRQRAKENERGGDA